MHFRKTNKILLGLCLLTVFCLQFKAQANPQATLVSVPQSSQLNIDNPIVLQRAKNRLLPVYRHLSLI
jgi:hypothetical protein